MRGSNFRQRDKVSGIATWPAELFTTARGILNGAAPFTGTQVYLPYCSQDFWIENATREDLHFRGSAIVQAAVSVLLSHHGLRNASTLLLAGSSAGGIGMLQHVDLIHEMLSESTTIGAVADSAFFSNAKFEGTGVFGFPRGEQFRLTTALHHPLCCGMRHHGR